MNGNLSKILNSKLGSAYKDSALKKICGRCCICGNIPMFEVIYNVQDATRHERYCNECVRKVYARDDVL